MVSVAVTPGVARRSTGGPETKILQENGTTTTPPCAVGRPAVAEILRFTRSGVAWQALGVMIGAYELALAYAIVLDYDVARFFADAEALYSYEGTRQMQTLIVGKSITGQSAFV